MADLPISRIQKIHPFTRVGIDYARPLPMRECRLRKARQYQIYVVVFMCITTKAVRLEIVSELSTNAFLAAFDQFIARRGLPHDVFPDCGTSFVGAAKYYRRDVPQHIIKLRLNAPFPFMIARPRLPWGSMFETQRLYMQTQCSGYIG